MRVLLTQNFIPAGSFRKSFSASFVDTETFLVFLIRGENVGETFCWNIHYQYVSAL
jgi:hypothetical protein